MNKSLYNELINAGLPARLAKKVVELEERIVTLEQQTTELAKARDELTAQVGELIAERSFLESYTEWDEL